MHFYLQLRLSVENHQLLRRSAVEKWGLRTPLFPVGLNHELERPLAGKRLRVIVHVTPSRHLGVHLVEVVGHPEYPVDRPLNLRCHGQNRDLIDTREPSIDADMKATSLLFQEFMAKVDAHRAGSYSELG